MSELVRRLGDWRASTDRRTRIVFRKVIDNGCSAEAKRPTETYRKSLIYSSLYDRLVLSLILLRHRKNLGFRLLPFGTVALSEPSSKKLRAASVRDARLMRPCSLSCFLYVFLTAIVLITLFYHR